MKIYTRGGDKGITSLLGGTRVPKNHPRIEAGGTLDEVISWLGLIRDQEESCKKKDVLVWIQDRLMVASAILSREVGAEANIPLLSDPDIHRLEQEIDIIENELPPLRSFIIPGGHTASSYCHICRSICRRAERLVVPLTGENSDLELVLKFLNRLADYLFVLARYILRISGSEEIKWNA